MRISCIILARGGSKGIPQKNIIDFCGKPLLAWTILQALKVDYVTDVWVSSDSKEILEIARNYGANCILRPKSLAGDNDSSELAWQHAVDNIHKQIGESIDYVLAPQVTSPVRSVEDFSNAITQIIDDRSDSLLSVVEIEDFFIWKNSKRNPQSLNYNYKNRKLRQKIEKKYLENGSFYIFKPDILKRENNRLGGRISLFVMEKYKMFQIDNKDEVELSSIIMKGYGLNVL